MICIQCSPCNLLDSYVFIIHTQCSVTMHVHCMCEQISEAQYLHYNCRLAANLELIGTIRQGEYQKVSCSSVCIHVFNV